MAGSRRQWGWHALTPAWAERIVATAGLAPGACVLDVGAGFGALTRPLLARGARVIAVERHAERAAGLRAAFGDDVVVVHADARDLRLPRRPFHVVANPPFSVTTPLLRRLLAPGSRMQTAHLVLQEQAARRWHALDAPGAGRWRRDYASELGQRLPRSAFRPPPHVPSRVLVLRRRSPP